MDPDQDPAIFVINLQDANKNYFKKISAYSFLKVHLHHFSKIKVNRFQEAQKHMDPADPDPQHWIFLTI